jgi:hypothetical protein
MHATSLPRIPTAQVMVEMGTDFLSNGDVHGPHFLAGSRSSLQCENQIADHSFCANLGCLLVVF